MPLQKKKCPKCGKFLSATAAACFYCGALLSDVDNDKQNEDELLDNLTAQQNVSTNSSIASNSHILRQSSTLDNSIDSNQKSIMKSIQKQNKQQELDINEEIEDEEEIEPEPIPVDTYEDDNDYNSSNEDDGELNYKNEEKIENRDNIFEQKDCEDEEELAEYQNDEEIDDYDAFNKLINNKAESSEEDISETELSVKSKKGSPSFRKASDEIKDNLKKSINSSKNSQKKKYDKKTISEKHKEYEEQQKEKSTSKKALYDPNSDGYYDNVIAAVDARIEHITKENVIHTVGVVISFIIIVAFMLYFVVL